MHLKCTDFSLNYRGCGGTITSTGMDMQQIGAPGPVEREKARLGKRKL